MKIKKKDLRRGLAQLPINYPAPDVFPDAFLDLGGAVDVGREMCAVEAICKQLGHNELAVRQAALDQVPAYICKVLQPVATMEAAYDGNGAGRLDSPMGHPVAFSSTSTTTQEDEVEMETDGTRKVKKTKQNTRTASTTSRKEIADPGLESEIETVLRFFSSLTLSNHRRRQPPKEKEEEEEAEKVVDRDWNETRHVLEEAGYYYHNLTEGLLKYREKVAKAHRVAQQRASLQALKQQRKERRQALANRGKYGEQISAGMEEDEKEEEENEEGETHHTAPGSLSPSKSVGSTSSATPRSREKKENPTVGGPSLPRHLPEAHVQKYEHWMKTWADVELILLKLCRGLFFCLWHTDKPLEQLACADTMSLLLTVPPTSRGQILLGSCFFRVLSREWPSIDHYRMDKYLALVRRLFQQLLQVIRREWEAQQKQQEESVSTLSSSSSSALEEEKTTSGRRHTKENSNPCPTSTTRRRRPRQDKEDEEKEEEETTGDVEEESTAVVSKRVSTSSPLTARGIVDYCIQHYLPSAPNSTFPALHRAIHEVVYLFQVHLVPQTPSVGMMMHLCDISFEELAKAFPGGACCSGLFVTLAAGIPLYAMSQGNGVEKRVLDHFFPPISAGMLLSRWTTQIGERLREAERASPRRQGRHTSGGTTSQEEDEKRVAKRETKEEREARIEKEASALAQQAAEEMLQQLLWCCQSFAVCRGTVRVVRVMFSEAELAVRQALEPEYYQPISRYARRQRIEKELEEVQQIRQQVRDEREGMWEAKRQVKRQKMEATIRERQEEWLAKHQDSGEHEEEDDEMEEGSKITKKKSPKMDTSTREGRRSSKMEKKKMSATRDGSKKTTKKKTTSQTATMEKGKGKKMSKAAMLRAAGLDRKSLLQALKEEEAKGKMGKKIKVVRNTKRKKDYQLTKKDLFGGDEKE